MIFATYKSDTHPCGARQTGMSVARAAMISWPSVTAGAVRATGNLELLFGLMVRWRRSSEESVNRYTEEVRWEIILLGARPTTGSLLSLVNNAPAVADRGRAGHRRTGRFGALSWAGPWSTGFMEARSITSRNFARGWAVPARGTPAVRVRRRPRGDHPGRRGQGETLGAGGMRKRSRSRRNAMRCTNKRTARRSSDEGICWEDTKREIRDLEPGWTLLIAAQSGSEAVLRCVRSSAAISSRSYGRTPGSPRLRSLP